MTTDNIELIPLPGVDDNPSRCQWTGDQNIFTKICLASESMPKRCLTAKSTADNDQSTVVAGKF